MDVAEFKVKLAEEIIEERESINNKYHALQVDNIKQLRSLIIQFIIIASAIIGFTIPVLNGGHLVKIPIILIGGMIEMLIVVVYGFYYLSNIIQKENNQLTGDLEAFNNFLDTKRDAKIEFMKDMNPANLKKYEESQKSALRELDSMVKKDGKGKDYSIDIIFWTFFLGLFLIVVSLLDVNVFANVLINNLRLIFSLIF